MSQMSQMSQMSFSDFEYAGKRKQTRSERFLAEMDEVVPWTGLLGLIEPFYPKAGRGRKPYPLETMLRIHLLQNWFSLSDPAMEEALYEVSRSVKSMKIVRSSGKSRRGAARILSSINAAFSTRPSARSSSAKRRHGPRSSIRFG